MFRPGSEKGGILVRQGPELTPGAILAVRDEGSETKGLRANPINPKPSVEWPGRSQGWRPDSAGYGLGGLRL